MQSIPDAILDWSKVASIHNKKLIPLTLEKHQDIFPISSQPVIKYIEQKQITHEAGCEIKDLRSWVLAQSFYHYFSELAALESRLICNANAGIVSDSYTVKFDHNFKQIASSIIIDEGYHSFCALDAVRQVEEQTGIKSVKMLKKNCAEQIFVNCRRLVEHRYWNDFTLVIASILEAILAKDLDLCLRARNKIENKNTSGYFYLLQENHFRDESRHSCFALLTLEAFWENITDEERTNLLPAIHEFVEQYSNFVSFGDAEFIKQVMAPISNDQTVIDGAIEFCQHDRKQEARQIQVSMLNMLNQTRVFC